MTKFDELVDIITKKKNKSKGYDSISSTDSWHKLEVAGSEGSKTPLLSYGDEGIDGSIIDDI
jgi:hypothetical protein